jgi:hypothetical protein
MQGQPQSQTQVQKLHLSLSVHNLFPGMLSPTLGPEVMKNDLRDSVNSFARGWHLFRGREVKVAAPKSSKMLATLLLQKVQ